MADKYPLVSVLIPCYNAERWIAQTIRSALDQTYAHTEVIVVDDGSTDGSLELIKSFGDRIQWETGPNRGANSARNRLLELARGEWVQYLDADDYLLPDKVARQVELLAEHPEADVICGPHTVEHCFEEGSRKEVMAIPGQRDPWMLLADGRLPQTGASLWRRKAILDVGSWKIDQPCCQEYELYLRLLMAGKQFAYCEHNGTVYRKWSNQTVFTRDPQENLQRVLEVVRSAENYLRSRGGLTDERRQAFNEQRFAIARLVWLYDPMSSRSILREIGQSQPDFSPCGKGAPRRFRIVYQLFGFDAAQMVALWQRKVTGAVRKVWNMNA